MACAIRPECDGTHEHDERGEWHVFRAPAEPGGPPPPERGRVLVRPSAAMAGVLAAEALAHRAGEAAALERDRRQIAREMIDADVRRAAAERLGLAAEASALAAEVAALRGRLR